LGVVVQESNALSQAWQGKEILTKNPMAMELCNCIPSSHLLVAANQLVAGVLTSLSGKNGCCFNLPLQNSVSYNFFLAPCVRIPKSPSWLYFCHSWHNQWGPSSLGNGMNK